MQIPNSHPEWVIDSAAAILMRAKQRMRPSAHPDLCLTTIPPGGRSGGWVGRSRHEAREPLRRARRVAGARRAGGPVRRRRGARALRGARLRRARRGGGDVPPVASPPAMRRLSGPEGRTRALGGAEAEAPGVRRRVHVADRHRPRGLQEAARDLGAPHRAGAVRRAARRLRGGPPHQPPRRPFAAVDGHRGRIVLRGRVRVDEAHADDADPSEGYGRARKRGPSSGSRA